jgi:hypothetical protein
MSGANKANIRYGIKKLAWDGIGNPYNFPSLYVATVDSVDIPNRTCTVTVVSDGVEIIKDNIALMAINDDGLLLIPTVGSQVRVLDAPNDIPCVIQYSEIDKLQLKVGTSTFDVITDLSQFNGGENGGIPKIVELTEIVNRLENKVNDLITKYNTHTHPYVNVAAPAVTSVTATVETPIAPLTTRTDYEDTKVTH